MKRVELAYGRNGMTVELPDDAVVIEGRPAKGLVDENEAIRAALRHPVGTPALADMVRRGDRVVIAHTDITRATPNERLLPVLLAELEAAGARREDILLLNALGTHRPQTDAELRQMLGADVVEKYHCEQHNAFDDASLVSLGETSQGHPVRLNRMLVEADVKILTGFIEPHFFAGFSGGPKGVLPALAGAESVLTNHGVRMIADPLATWGVTEGNPIWEEMREMALRVAPLFLLNVTLNRQREITGVFAGDVIAAHREGCAFAKEHSMVKVDEPFDVVVTTNSGYPLDQNLYQSVKGLSAAARVARPGGAIVIATACEDGLPEHGKYAELLRRAGSPAGVLEMIAEPGFSAHDSWQVQVQAQVQQKADVYVISDGLSDEQIRAALFTPCHDVTALVAELVQRVGPRVCVLPEGPQTVAYV